MNVLFEIPDFVLIIAGVIIVLILGGIALFVKIKSRKVKPIDEDDRYDSDEIEVQEISEDELTDEQKKAKEELSRVFDKMSEDLEKQNNEKTETETEIEMFEKEQEENAIISYQELMAQAETLKKEATQYEKKAETKADMKLRDALNSLDRREEHRKKSKIVKEEPQKHQYKSFKSSDIVSPIYGVQSNKGMFKKKNVTKEKKSDIISEAYGKKHFQEEKTQNLDFLNSLKEFRKNL